MENIQLKAYAKINLCLDIVGKYENGYHQLKMIMQQIELADTIKIERADRFKLTTNHKNLQTDSSNICYKAYKLLAETYNITENVHIHIEKNIPLAAGLAGGSTDAAAVLIGLNQIWDLNLDAEKLRELGLKLGADVPYCIEGGVQIAEGVGEYLTKIDCVKEYYMVLLNSGVEVSTKEVFQNYNIELDQTKIPLEIAVKALETGDETLLAKSMGNKLELVTLEKYPELKTIKQTLLDHGAFAALMSGSGPSIFGLFTEKSKAENCYNHFKNKIQFAVLTKTKIN